MVAPDGGAPVALPWPTPMRLPPACRPAAGVGIELRGASRWRHMAQQALGALASASTSGIDEDPLIVGSCNGGADDMEADAWRRAFDPRMLLAGTPWAERVPAIASASCASGLHALSLASAAITAGAPRVTVLAVDVLGAVSQSNFGSLRVLTHEPRPPFDPDADGFVVGEAAVAVSLVRCDRSDPRALGGPVLGYDDAFDLHARLDRAPNERALSLVVAQATGPAMLDDEELAELARAADPSTAVASPIGTFGHTLGASSLLALALLHQGRRLEPGLTRTRDGRRITGDFGTDGSVLVHCRALGGMRGAVGRGLRLHPTEPRWREPVDAGPMEPLMLPALQELVNDVRRLRPSRPPAALFVRLSQPVMPTARARWGGRLLPSAVMEMTPATAALAVARAWSYDGPCSCLVGPFEIDPRDGSIADPARGLLEPVARADGEIAVVYVMPDEHERRCYVDSIHGAAEQ